MRFRPLASAFFLFFGRLGALYEVFIAHTDDILGRGGQDVPTEIRQFSEQRYGDLRLQESSFAHVGMDLAQGGDASVALAQDEFTKNAQPILNSLQPLAARPEKLLIKDI